MLDNILKLEGVKKLEKSEQKQVHGGADPNSPCGTTGFIVLPYSQVECFGYGVVWYRGRCLACL